MLTKEVEKAAVEAFNKPESLAAYSADDMEFDRQLERLSQEHVFQDNEPVIELKKSVDKPDLLRSHVEDYKPAGSIVELMNQVHTAKGLGCDAVEATAALLRHVFKRDFEHIQNITGYGIYQDIKVYIDGLYEKMKDKDKVTMEQRLFGPK